MQCSFYWHSHCTQPITTKKLVKTVILHISPGLFEYGIALSIGISLNCCCIRRVHIITHAGRFWHFRLTLLHNVLTATRKWASESIGTVAMPCHAQYTCLHYSCGALLTADVFSYNTLRKDLVRNAFQKKFGIAVIPDHPARVAVWE